MYCIVLISIGENAVVPWKTVVYRFKTVPGFEIKELTHLPIFIIFVVFS